MSSTPRRRSSRLRGSNGDSTLNQRHNGFSSKKLTSLAEGDETSDNGTQSNFNTILSSPLAPQTPATTGGIKPSRFEMHPAHGHRSTTKLPSEGLSLGFTDVQNEKAKGTLQDTPSKGTSITSPSFDFRFARPAPELGPAAQRMMEELRDEALRIKAKLAAEREADRLHETGEDSLLGRRIAKPKGKAGRFSDVHMEEFKKMDSIAGHASAFRGQLGRFETASGSLKRSQSKAKLNEDEKSGSTFTQKSLKRTQSKAKLDDSGIEPHQPSTKRTLKRTQSKARLDDDGTDATSMVTNRKEQVHESMPSKRARLETTEPCKTPSKAVAKATPSKASTPSIPRSLSMLAALTTPTQSSLARTASVKRATNLPALIASPSKATLATPSKLTKSSTVGSLGSIARSLMRRADKSPEKPAIPVIQTPSKLNINKRLPTIPSTPRLTHSKSVKRMDVTPSPQKSGIPRSKTTATIAAGVSYPQLTSLENVSSTQAVQYPSLDNRHLPGPLHQAKVNPVSPPFVPGTFTFTANQTIKFGVSPRGFGASPGQSSLRQVRPSIALNNMPGSFPHDNKENGQDLPSIPHGIPNKKRAHAEEELEDIPSFAHGITNKKRHRAEASGDDTEDEVKHSPKKHKTYNSSLEDTTKDIPRLQQKLNAEKAAPQSRIPSPAKKTRLLSLSRLNMLARPKNKK